MGCNGNSSLRRAWFACETDCGRVLAPYFYTWPHRAANTTDYTFVLHISPSLTLNCLVLLRTSLLIGYILLVSSGFRRLRFSLVTVSSFGIVFVETPDRSAKCERHPLLLPLPSPPHPRPQRSRPLLSLARLLTQQRVSSPPEVQYFRVLAPSSLTSGVLPLSRTLYLLLYIIYIQSHPY